jgi:beta-mannosidase
MTRLLPTSLLLLLAGTTALSCGRYVSEGPAVLELNGGWHFREVGTPATGGAAPDTGQLAQDTAGPAPDTTWRPAHVPGTVHMDLLADSVIPDPFYGTNESKLQWIGRRDWEYATTFGIPSFVFRHRHFELRFGGLDTYADVRLNGRPVLRADNMFRTWTVDVTKQVRPGSNRLDIVFHSPIPREDSMAAAFPYRLPAGNDPHGTRVFTRKAAYHYGWDWGPRFVTAGVWRPVLVRAWSGVVLRDAFIRQNTLTDTLATLTAHVTVQADTTTDGTLVVRSPDHAFPKVQRSVHLEPGDNDVALDFAIPRPKRWWPNGLGPHPLYTVIADIQAAGARDTLSRHIGLRTLEVVNRPDSIGRSFYVRVNGVPVFMKGANYIPQDHFTPRVDRARYAALFRDVVDSHMNMLRVWGGGIYERNLFYDLADENGILVWQDFMFANGMYPVTPSFLANVRVEAEQQVKRLRNHPSLALWCGNNEIREGWENWGWQRQMGYSPADSAAVWTGYVQLFDQLLPSIVDSLDPGVFYHESSPTIGWGHPESMTTDDSHYWGVWWGGQPFDTLRTLLPRFMSEFGFQAYPPLPTIASFTQPGDRAVGSTVMDAHQKNAMGDSTIQAYMARWFRPPQSFDRFVYLSQVLQAEGLKIAFEAQRRAMPRTMGTLYWQLDDTWPVVSWSGRDYYGRWKALQYYVRRAFALLLVSPALEHDSVRVYVVSDRLTPVQGTLTVRTLTFDGRELYTTTSPVTLPADTSIVALSVPLAEALGRHATGGTAGAGGRDAAAEADSSDVVPISPRPPIPRVTCCTSPVRSTSACRTRRLPRRSSATATTLSSPSRQKTSPATCTCGSRAWRAGCRTTSSTCCRGRAEWCGSRRPLP